MERRGKYNKGRLGDIKVNKKQKAASMKREGVRMKEAHASVTVRP